LSMVALMPGRYHRAWIGGRVFGRGDDSRHLDGSSPVLLPDGEAGRSWLTKQQAGERLVPPPFDLLGRPAAFFGQHAVDRRGPGRRPGPARPRAARARPGHFPARRGAADHRGGARRRGPRPSLPRRAGQSGCATPAPGRTRSTGRSPRSTSRCATSSLSSVPSSSPPGTSSRTRDTARRRSIACTPRGPRPCCST